MKYCNATLHISLSGIFTIHKNIIEDDKNITDISCYVDNSLFFHEIAKSNRKFNKKTKFIKYHRGFFRFKLKDIIKIDKNIHCVDIHFNNNEAMTLTIFDKFYQDRIIDQLKKKLI